MVRTLLYGPDTLVLTGRQALVHHTRLALSVCAAMIWNRYFGIKASRLSRITNNLVLAGWLASTTFNLNLITKFNFHQWPQLWLQRRPTPFIMWLLLLCKGRGEDRVRSTYTTFAGILARSSCLVLSVSCLPVWSYTTSMVNRHSMFGTERMLHEPWPKLLIRGLYKGYM